MLEQAVSKWNNGRERRWKNILRGMQIVLAVILAVCEVFGFTLAGVYRQMGDAYFWQWILQMVVLGLPMLTVILLLQIPIHRLMVEYDYNLLGQAFSCYRFYGSRRKWYFSFDLNTVTVFKDIREIDDGSEEEQLLREAVIVSCNEDAKHLMLVHSADCVIGRKRKKASFVLELNDTFHTAFKRELRGIVR